MARGVDGRDIYGDDVDRHKFLRKLLLISSESKSQILAYCLMNNHFHLAIRVGKVPLAKVMQRILTSHSASFNRKYERTGHLFQARYKAVLCKNDTYLTALIRYIHANPVRAGLVQTDTDWPWSSARDFTSRGKAPQIRFIGDLPELNVDAEFDPWPRAEKPLPPSSSKVETRVPLESIAEAISSGNPSRDVRQSSRIRELTALKRQFTLEALNEGHSLTEIAHWLGLALSSVRHYARTQ